MKLLSLTLCVHKCFLYYEKSSLKQAVRLRTPLIARYWKRNCSQTRRTGACCFYAVCCVPGAFGLCQLTRSITSRQVNQVSRVKP